MNMVDRLIGLVWRHVLSKVISLYLRVHGVRVGNSCIFYGIPEIRCVKGSVVEIGAHVVICSISKYTALGVNHPVIIRALLPGAQICVGDNVGLSGSTIVAARRINIGKNSMLGANTTVCDTDFHPISPSGRRGAKLEDAASSPIDIGENVFIGAGAMILKGVVIGRNSVIGAATVVTAVVPPDTIAAGNPAEVIRSVD